MRLTLIGLFVILGLIISGCADLEQAPEDTANNTISGTITDTNSTDPGKLTIDSIGTFDYDPRDITTMRPDLFKPRHFSIFDILVYLDSTQKIDMQYHFDEDQNTYVIDSINQNPHWWYMAYYDGGWPETNVFRMDHYPHKNGMYIRIIREDAGQLERKYAAFAEEIARKKQNDGKIIIPEVIIDGPKTRGRFRDVEVQPHDLRPDLFQPGVITAIDAIMTLGDEGRLTYGLQWYDSIGSAGFVRDFYIDRINEDQAYFRCGFVYEAGSLAFSGFRGNHIHIPSDMRIINSPEYEEWFWICL